MKTLARAASRYAAAHARLVLVVAALVTLLPLPGLMRLRRDTDASALVPRGDPAVRIDRELRRRFDLRDQLILHFDGGRPGGIFDARLLAAVREVTDAVAAIPEIGPDHVMSLATETRDRLYPGSGDTYSAFLRFIPSTPREMDELREDLQRPTARLLTGTIVSADRRTTAILAGVAEEGDRLAVMREIRAILEPHRRAGLAIDIVGAPAASALLAEHIARDLALLVPLSLLVIAAVIGFATRRIAPVLMILMKAGLCIAWTFAVLGWLGVPLYLTSTIVPLVLAAACIADELHLVMRYQRALAAGEADPVRATTDDLALSVVAATLTTCIGFLACLATPIEPVRALGAACAIGIAWSLLFSLFVTPALLECGGKAAAFQSPRQSRGIPKQQLRRRTPIVTAAITLVALIGATRITIQDSWIDCFAPQSDFRRATDFVNRQLHGVHLLHVVVSTADRGTVAALEERLRGRDTVGGVIGAASQLAVIAEFWRLGDDSGRLYDRFDLSPGIARRRRVVSDERDAAVVTAFLKSANFRSTAALIETARAFARERNLSVAFAGDVAVSQAMIPAVVRGQVVSLPLALLGVFASVTLICGSARLALYAIIPAAVSGIWILGALGFAGIPLGVATSMFFAISIGLGVDSHSIHLIARYRETRDAAASLADTGRAILVNTLAVAAGFGLVAFSSVPPNRRLGLLIAAGLVAGCAVTLTTLASLLAFESRSVRPEEADHASPVVCPTHERQEVAS